MFQVLVWRENQWALVVCDSGNAPVKFQQQNEIWLPLIFFNLVGVFNQGSRIL